MQALSTRAASDRRPISKADRIVRPRSADEIRTVLEPRNRFPTPIRPVGTNTSATGCTSAEGGTILDMTAMNEILSVDSDTVTVQAGVTLHALADALADHGLELAGGYDFSDRTVGGAVCGACMGPSLAADQGLLSAQVVRMKAITGEGEPIEVTADRPELMAMFRLSYGLLGVVYELTLRVRPIQPFTVLYRKLTFGEFGEFLPKLRSAKVGVKCYLMPFRNRVYAELRRYELDGGHASRSLPWKIKDWVEHSAAPKVARSVSRAIPIRGVRYSLIDGFNKATHALLDNRLVHTGSHAVEQTGRYRTLHDRTQLAYSSWSFPARDFDNVLHGYRAFCLDYYRRDRFRCDMPTVAYRVSQDSGAILSPSFDQPMFILSALSTPNDAWQDFVIDFSDFAAIHDGVPIFSQSKGVTVQHAEASLGSRLDFFRRARRRLDPDDRMVNPFLMQYMQ